MLPAEVLQAASAADAGQPLTSAEASSAGPGAAGSGAPVLDSAQDPKFWVEAAVQYGRPVRELLPEAARAAWTDERLENFGHALARCSQHYGWTFGAALTHPLGLLAAASIPLVWPLLEPRIAPMLKRLQDKAAPAGGSAGAGAALSTLGTVNSTTPASTGAGPGHVAPGPI